MNFYAEPVFFVFAALAVIPAVVLACLEKPLRHYSFVVSVVFVALLFRYNPEQGVAFLVFLFIATVLSRIVLRLFLTEYQHAIALYRVAFALTCTPLFIYKFAAVFDSNLLGFIGISYLTFKALQVLIEIRDGLITELSLFDYVSFLIFFTPFTSGPIMRSRPFVEQIHHVCSRAEYLEGLSLGALRFLLGCLYKFVFAALCNWAMWFLPEYIGQGSFIQGFASESAVALFYGLYLFFDFAGYSLMAIGLGAAFGVSVPRNFLAPFAAVDIKDFWNRWHITLSHWLRDFVFMRFSRACIQRKIFSSRTTTACFGYLINMTIMGFWHGVTIDYISYGIFHGLLLAICEVFQKSAFYRAHKQARWLKVVSYLATMVAVFFGFSLFSGQVSRLVLGG